MPLASLMPDGTEDTLVDAYKDGLDGRTFYVDASADTSVPKIRYYNVNRQRPKTLIEILDELIGGVVIAGPKGDKGDAGEDGTPGSSGTGGFSFTWTAFPSVANKQTTATAATPTINATFYVDFDQFDETIDVYLSVLAKEGAAAYPGGVAAWAADDIGIDSGPDPYFDLGSTLLGLCEVPAIGTAGAYKGLDDTMLGITNPGGKMYLTITSFAGATTPESDVGAVTLEYYGLTLRIQNAA